VPNEEDQRFLHDVFERCAEVTVLELSGGLEPINPPDESESAEDTDAAPEEAADETEAEPEGDTASGDETTYEIASEWPTRKLRAWALDVDIHGEDALTSKQTDDMSKDDILDYFFPEDGDEPANAPDPEPEPPKAARKRTTPPQEAKVLTGRQRAVQVREEAEEATGEEVTRPAARKTAAKATAGEGRVRAQKAKDAVLADEALDRLSGRDGDEAQADPTLEFVRLYANEIADIIIDRIAARVEAEPVDSAVRKEVAPPRPPGRPRADGEAPVRRTVARSRR
jgi:hypothetical protein